MASEYSGKITDFVLHIIEEKNVESVETTEQDKEAFVMFVSSLEANNFNGIFMGENFEYKFKLLKEKVYHFCVAQNWMILFDRKTFILDRTVYKKFYEIFWNIAQQLKWSVEDKPLYVACVHACDTFIGHYIEANMYPMFDTFYVHYDDVNIECPQSRALYDSIKNIIHMKLGPEKPLVEQHFYGEPELVKEKRNIFDMNPFEC